MKGTIKALGVLACVAAAVAAMNAHAAGGKVKTRVSMSMTCQFGSCEPARAVNEGTFNGKVRSRSASCVDGRVVKVVHKGLNPRTVGTDEAAADGTWEVTDDLLEPGTYFAKTKRAPGCRNAKSKRWELTFR